MPSAIVLALVSAIDLS